MYGVSPLGSLDSLMINPNSSKDGFRPCTEKPTASSEDFFSPLHCNAAKIHIHSPFILLLFHLVSRKISSVSLLAVPWGLQAQPGCCRLWPQPVSACWHSLNRGWRASQGVSRHLCAALPPCQWNHCRSWQGLIVPGFGHGRENLLWHRRITNAFLLPGLYQLLVSLWQINVSVPNADTSESGRRRKKKKKKQRFVHPKMFYLTWDHFPEAWDTSWFWGVFTAFTATHRRSLGHLR